MELYLIRHAQSSNNALHRSRRHERVSDAPLTELGQRQAAALAQHLATGVNPGPASAVPDASDQRGYNLTRLYCSPMWRALHTARPIAEALGLRPNVWVDIHEQGGIFLDHGEVGGMVGYPGKTRQEIVAEFPDYLLPEYITDQGWWKGGYEDRPACHGRAMRVAEELRQWAETDERIALVTHGGFMDSLLKALFNTLPGDKLFFYHHNTAISRIDFRDNGRVVVRYLGRTDHLSADLLSA